MNLVENVSFREPYDEEILRAASYLVVDPCYVFGEPQGLWDKVCDALYPLVNGVHTNKDRIVMEIGNDKVYIFSTAYGDGSYPVMVNGVEKGHCGVDAGLLCFVSKNLMTEIDGDDSLGTWIDVLSDSLIDDNEEGDVRVGEVFVCTCGCADEDEEYDEEDAVWQDKAEDFEDIDN